MHRRVIGATAAVAAALLLGGCASTATGTAATPDAMSTPTQSATSEPAEAAPAESETPVPAEPEPMAAGAYLDYEDGIIARTAGPKALFFHATWCPNCRQLDEELRAAGAPDGLTVFKVDYDSRTDLRRQYGVTLQTTVVFVDDDGTAISSRVLYDDPSIAALVAAQP